MILFQMSSLKRIMFTIFKNRKTRQKVISVVLFHEGWGTTIIIVDVIKIYT